MSKEASIPEPRLAIRVCIKNEAPFLEAHLKYHRYLGVSKAYVYLDGCTDESLDIARSFHWVECFEVDPGERRRFTYPGDLLRACMDDALQRARGDGYDWLLVIDADEFAFGENQEMEGAENSLRRKGSLLDLLARIPAEIEMVKLRTREVVPTYRGEGFEFWKQKYFQDEHVLTRTILDPCTGETRIWSDFLIHRQGKSIVRTSASVQAYDSHRWVRDQHILSPLRPAYVPVPTESAGYHYHFFAFQNSQFRNKFQKYAEQPGVWPCGNPVEFPKQCWKVASKRLAEQDLYEYLDRHFYLSEPELQQLVSEGKLLYDDTVERVLGEVGYFSRCQQLLQRSKQQLGKIWRTYKPDRARLLEPSVDGALVVSDGNAVTYEASIWRDGSFSGFYSLEICNERYFRWSSTRAEVVVPLEAGDYRLGIDVGSILKPGWKKYVGFSFNGRKIPGSALAVEGTCINFEVEPADCLPNRQRLSLDCSDLDTSAWAHPDCRKLGIPVFGISVTTANSADMSEPATQPAERVSLRLPALSVGTTSSGESVLRQQSLKASANRKPRLAMQVCLKNEASFLEPHFRYHQHLGVSKAYAYLDACTDESLDILRSFWWVECFAVDPAERRRCTYTVDLQRACMDDALHRARRDGYDWLLVIDPDEFAFGENEGSESKDSSPAARGSLVDMLTQVPANIEMVKLRTREVVPAYKGEGFEFWKQRYFQDEQVLARKISDPSTGEARTWSEFLGHRQGKSIIRTSASVQAYDSHRWVRDQKMRSPLRPAHIPIPTESRGYHDHFFIFQNSQFKEKFQKKAILPKVWIGGYPLEYPIHCFRVASTSLTDDALREYLDRHVYLTESELQKRLTEGQLIYDDTVEKTLRELGYFGRCQQFLRRCKRLVGRILRSDHPVMPRLLAVNGEVPLLVPDENAIFYNASMWPDSSCSGFYHLESHSGRYFRWSSANAELVLPLGAGDYEVGVDVGSILQPGWEKHLSLEFNGREIPGCALRLEGSCASFEVKKLDCLPTEQRLTINCSPLDTSSWSYGDPRQLGIPVFGISLSVGSAAKISGSPLEKVVVPDGQEMYSRSGR